MVTYQQALWGYQVEYPDDWLHTTIQDTECFALDENALKSGYSGPNSGNLLIRGEWNWSREPLEPHWNQHIAKLSVMLGAKKLGTAPWEMGGSHGFEAEVLLPKKTQKRLWIGLLANNSTILHFSVSHQKSERDLFEPQFTQIIQSLRFITHADNTHVNHLGIPIPPEYNKADPRGILNDITNVEDWLAYDGLANTDALQAFYIRELGNHGWVIDEYVPYPAPTQLDFARFRISKHPYACLLGILPIGESAKTGKIIIKTRLG